MAKIIRCDGGCKRESPNEHRLHVANHWIKVRAAVVMDFEKAHTDKDMYFCTECWDRVQNTIRAA